LNNLLCPIISSTPSRGYTTGSEYGRNATHSRLNNLLRPIISSTPSRGYTTGSEYSVIRLTPKSLQNAEVNIRQILNSTSIHARDILSLGLDGTLTQSRSRPLILPRGESVVISLGHVKAIVYRDEALLFNGSHPNVSLFASEVHRQCIEDDERHTGQQIKQDTNFPKLEDAMEASHPLLYTHARRNHLFNNKPSDSSQQFEMLFLEEALREICQIWRRRVQLIKPIVDSLLESSTSDGLSEDLHRLVPLKDSLQSFQMKVEETITCVVELLASDEDMLGLMLTENAKAKAEGTEIHTSKHESTELLLEDYNRQLNGILSDVHFLQKRVQTKQELAAIGLDAYRNRMIRMNVQLAVGTVCLSTMTVVAGFFGMNLVSGFEDHESMFLVTVGGSGVAAIVLYAACHNFLSGKNMRKRVREKATEINAITAVLNNMDSLDFAIKRLLQEADSNLSQGKYNSIGFGSTYTSNPHSHSLTKERFKSVLAEVRGPGKKIERGEVELIFGILDKSGDGVMDYNELGKLKRELIASEKG